MLSIAAATMAVVTAAHADIFQWEYVNPSDPSQGKQQSTTLAAGGAGVDAVPGANILQQSDNGLFSRGQLVSAYCKPRLAYIPKQI
jgi:hypothetical protein